MRSVSTIIARLCLACLPVFFLLPSEAQQNSPFTRYGLGEFYTNQHILSRSMGGLTAAYADGLNNNVGQSVNFSNPATYSGLYMTTFDLGFTIDSRSLSSRTPLSKFSTNNFIPSYLSIGIPIKKTKGLGLAFGLKPQSSISYSIETRERIASDSLQTVYEGSGGLNQVFVGLGKRWKNDTVNTKWKSFGIGFNTGYNFGRKDITTRKAFLNDTVSYYQSKSSSTTNFSGMFLNGGLQYEFVVNQKTTVATKTTETYFLRLGLTGTLQQSLNATQDIAKQTYTTTTSGDIKIDSVSEQANIKGTILIPSTYAAGITFHKATSNTRGTFEMWSLGAEYTSTQWTNYRFYGQPDKLSNSWDMKFGAQFCPDPLTSLGFWNNVNYRVGFSTGQDYLNPDGNGLKHYEVSFGAGLPVRRWRSYDYQNTYMNTSLQFGKRGSAINNVTETYIQFSLGISLSDLWFQKRKYD